MIMMTMKNKKIRTRTRTKRRKKGGGRRRRKRRNYRGKQREITAQHNTKVELNVRLDSPVAPGNALCSITLTLTLMIYLLLL